jgi:hypothetical protein
LKLHPDFSDFVEALNDNNVEYVVVGSFALAFHGSPRATGDIDFWIRPSTSNAKALIKALEVFGFGALDISEEDIVSGKIIQLGFPPVRIDIITIIDGLIPEEIWDTKEKGKLGPHDVFYLGKEAFIKNKRTMRRHKDLADLELLGEKP